MIKSTTISFLRKLGLSSKEYSLKNITRIGKKRATTGWWVRINNDVIQCSKTFYDNNYDSPLASFHAAEEFRDSHPKNIKSNTGYEFISITIKDEIYPTLKVTLKPYEKAFSIRTYGYREALCSAINFRNKKTKKEPVNMEDLSIKKGMDYLEANLNAEIFKGVQEKANKN
ncbi:MAG: hypothetical protein U9R39_04830 [Campylobacterota bacterium]|nr:hypothetical protein [Campylobacterota bacterium]